MPQTGEKKSGLHNVIHAYPPHRLQCAARGPLQPTDQAPREGLIPKVLSS